MPLYSSQKINKITRVPQCFTAKHVIERISQSDYDAIVFEIDRIITAAADSSSELIVSHYLPMQSWKGGIWEPIYNASRNNEELCEIVLGTIFFEIIMNRAEEWVLRRYFSAKDISKVSYVMAGRPRNF